jgi:hypothetical protein
MQVHEVVSGMEVYKIGLTLANAWNFGGLWLVGFLASTKEFL